MKTRLIQFIALLSISSVFAQNDQQQVINISRPGKSIYFEWNSSVNSWDLKSSYFYEYNQIGQKTKQTEFYHTLNRLRSKDSLVYNSQGKLIEEFLSSFDTGYNRFVFNEKFKYCFDNQGRDCGNSKLYFNSATSNWEKKDGSINTYKFAARID